MHFRTYSFADWGECVECGEERGICPRLAVSSWVGHPTGTKSVRIQVFASGQVQVGPEKSSVAKGASSLIFDVLDLRAPLSSRPRWHSAFRRESH